MHEVDSKIASTAISYVTGTNIGIYQLGIALGYCQVGGAKFIDHLIDCAVKRNLQTVT